MLFHIILHCIILSFIAFHCMSCVFPYYIVLYYILDCIVLFLCTLHCGLYSCFVLFWTVSYGCLLFIFPYSTYFVISCHAQGHFQTSFKSFHFTSHHFMILFSIYVVLCFVVIQFLMARNLPAESSQKAWWWWWWWWGGGEDKVHWNTVSGLHMCVVWKDNPDRDNAIDYLSVRLGHLHGRI